MHILYASREYNYNPTDNAANYFQIAYTRGGTPYTLRIEIPNYAILIQTLIEAINDPDILADKKAFIGTADPKGLYVECGYDYLGFEQVRFYNDVDTITGITLHTTGSGPEQYLYNHLGFTQNLSTNTGITLSTVYVGDYLRCPFAGAFRLPLNIGTGITRGGVEIISQVSSDYEIVNTTIDGGSDITPLNIYNSYRYTLQGKRINVINYPFSKLYAMNNFLEFISEDACTVSINTTLKTMLFGSAIGDTVKVDVSESGDVTVRELQENLTSYDIVLYHLNQFRSV